MTEHNGAGKGGAVAVIGSGLAGLTAALRLADAGLRVVIFERNATLFSGASAVCEGKIHLGYTYALDPSHATTGQLLAGAASFRRILTRWIPQNGLGISERSFIYACPRDSMVAAEVIETHLAQVQDQVDNLGKAVLCQQGKRLRRLPPAELGMLFDPALIAAAWETNEVASHPSIKRPFLLSALQSQPLIETRTEAEVTAITRDDAGWIITSGAEGLRERFSVVINASWEQRLRLDAQVGLQPPRRVLHRFQRGLHLRNAALADSTPNVTFVIGEYGDTVACGDRVYLSWYPAGFVKSDSALAPDPAPVHISPAMANCIRQDTIAALGRYLPGYATALAPHAGAFEVQGGYISAWGTSGISDPHSELHNRAEIGVTSLPGFHSINTGKYTTAPLYGEEAALRVLAERGVSA